ncbi:hypothetical protein NDU88_003858 [Pleurodeles waltl]|uniref:Uncharacterized protein n=1 Tax=Pleurodeles waltl TaxID=8319 RepID=A0AAV7SH42_PLEWA|nr:hypothetical protein NDU88_003858 [Pleurodeles waltl]
MHGGPRMLVSSKRGVLNLLPYEGAAMSYPNSDSLDSMVSGLHGTDASVRLVLEASAEDYDEGSDEWEEGEVLEEMVARHLAWKSMRRSGAMKKPVGVLQKSSTDNGNIFGQQKEFRRGGYR